MNWGNIVSSILIAAIGALALWTGQRINPGIRWKRQLEQEQRIAAALPADSTERGEYELYVRRLAARLLKYHKENKGGTKFLIVLATSLCVAWYMLLIGVVIYALSNDAPLAELLGGGVGWVFWPSLLLAVGFSAWVSYGGKLAELPVVQP